MTWSVHEVGQLLKLAEAGDLSFAELERAAKLAPLRPSREAWLLAADRLLAFAGVLLLGAAVVFFLAYNWAELHRFAKFGLATAGLASCVGVALFSQPFGTVYRAALLGACIVTGALLALVGQTYQTGADIWELFFAWTMLMLPFALLARSSASWALWLVVANVALVRGLAQARWSVTLEDWFGPVAILLVAGLNLAALLLFEILGERLLSRPRRHLPRLAVAGVLAPLIQGATIGWWGGEFAAVTLVFYMVAAVGFKVYFNLRRDVLALALVAFSLIAVMTAGLYRAFDALATLGAVEGAFFQLVMTVMYPLIAVFLIGGSVVAARWLLQLHREGAAS
jgi:uncharacterized membrane protein